MPRLRRSLLPATVALLALPAAANAATFTVDPRKPNTDQCEAGVCKTISQALSAASAGDEIVVKDGDFSENLLVDKQNILLRAENPGKVNLTGASTDEGADTITVGTVTPPDTAPLLGIPVPGTGGEFVGDGNGFKLSGINVSTPASGGSAVFVRSRGVTLESGVFGRAATSSSDGAVIEVDEVVAPGEGEPVGTTLIAKAFVVQLTGSVGAVANEAGLISVEDTVLAAAKGPALVSTGSGGRVVRSQLLALDTAANALAVSSSTAGEKRYDLDSALLNAGQNGAAVTATTESGSGVLRIVGLHVTAAGSRAANVLNAADADGRIVASYDGSIVRGVNDLSENATLDIVNSDTTQKAAPRITTGGTQESSADDLFVDPAKENFLLKPRSPAINKFRKAAGGESAKDVNGDDRVIGDLSDLGADEYRNTPPTAALKADRTEVSRGGTVTFDASGSSDPDGDPLRYLVDFGDGTRKAFDTPTFQHTYANDGQYSVRMVAFDPSGGLSAVVQGLTITVKDADAPSVSVSTPKANQAIRRSSFKTTTKRTRLKGRTSTGKPRFRTTKRRVRVYRTLTFRGTAADALSGVPRVEVGLQRGEARSNGQCAFFDGKRSFRGRPCRKVVWTAVRVTDGAWRFRFKTSAKFRAGSYTFLVRAIDGTGNASSPVSVPFTLR